MIICEQCKAKSYGGGYVSRDGGKTLSNGTLQLNAGKFKDLVMSEDIKEFMEKGRKEMDEIRKKMLDHSRDVRENALITALYDCEKKAVLRLRNLCNKIIEDRKKL